jgi:glycerol kinase
VARPRSIETTGFGAAALAGLAEGVWDTVGDLAALWTEDASFDPVAGEAEADAARRAWARALERSRGWVER